MYRVLTMYHSWLHLLYHSPFFPLLLFLK
jgi:hypothetical protein